MKIVKLILLSFFLQYSLISSAQLFGANMGTTARTVSVKLDVSRMMYPLFSWQTSLDVRLFPHLSFESELNFYERFSYENKADITLGAMKTQFSKKPHFFVSGIIKLHTKKNRLYVGMRGAIGRVEVEYQRLVCQETQLSPGGLCECTKWKDVHILRKMKQYMLGWRLGYKFNLSEKVYVDLYMDGVAIKYYYPDEADSLFDASCSHSTKTTNPFNKLPVKRKALAEEIFWAKSGEWIQIIQPGLKFAYVF